jgi:uncharacterized membrane protein YdbT with pleckstrin-like domain
MTSLQVKPSTGYLKKLRFIFTIIALIGAAFGYVFGFLIGLEHGPEVALTVFMGFVIADLAWWILAMLLAGPYYRSLGYEILDEEVIVRAGIVTKSVKHVPYRTVTNITVNRGLLDRYLFNLGTLNIQTAGMSGTTGAEESLVGLADVQGAYDVVVKKLRSFRGAMTPTAAETESETPAGSDAVLNSILQELKAIRKNTEA